MKTIHDGQAGKGAEGKARKGAEGKRGRGAEGNFSLAPFLLFPFSRRLTSSLLLALVCGVLLNSLARAADPVTEAFQKGLFEEEANHNLDAAIKAYQEVISRLDEQRRLGATAVFRLGECYRKLGRTNEAVAQYERIVSQFADQVTLANLSKQNLVGLGKAPPSSAGIPGQTDTTEHARLLKLWTEMKKLNASELVKLLPTIHPDPFLDEMQKEFLRLTTKYSEQRVEFAQEHPAVRATLAARKELESRMEDRANEILRGLEIKLASLAPTLRSQQDGLETDQAVTTDEEEKEVRRIQALIRDSPDLINARNVQLVTFQGGPRVGTPLHKAAQQGQLQVAAFLLNNNAEINAEDQTGSTPLHWAAANGHKSVVELLLSRKANPNARVSVPYPNGGSTPLHLAAEKGYRSVCDVLLANGANPNLPNNGQETPLHEAAGRGDEASVRLLLEKGADVKAKTQDGVTALHRTGSTNIAALLLQRGADVNARSKDDNTPLHAAAGGNRSALAELLLAHKADPNASSRNGWTPLHNAASGGSAAVIAPLIRHRADPNLRNNDGAVPLDLTMTDKSTPRNLSSAGSFTEALTALLEGGANPNPPGERLWTPLYRAVAFGHVEMVEILLKHGANPNVQIDKDSTYISGITPLLRAVNGKFPGIVELLLESKADANLGNDNGEVPLHWAIGGDKREATEALLQHGADVEARNKSGDTPLAVTVSLGKRDLAALLLKFKANPNAKSSQGRTPLHLATFYDKREMVDLLLAAKADPNVLDDQGLTPLDYLKHGVRFDAMALGGALPGPVAIGGPRPLNPSQTDLADKLRQAGAVDWAPRPNQITVIRRSSGVSQAVFHLNTNGWNRHTLFEVLASAPGFCIQCSDFPFPDFTNVRITRRDPTTTRGVRDFTVDVQAKVESGDCKEDQWLAWGDLVDIPEREHKLNEQWLGLPKEFADGIAKCLNRSVTITVKGQRHTVPLNANVVARRQTTDGQGLDWQVRLPALRLREAVLSGGLVLTTSDLSRVAFSRIDPESRQMRTALFNLKEKYGPGSQLWLRDGDVIEVPEKEAANADTK